MDGSGNRELDRQVDHQLQILSDGAAEVLSAGELGDKIRKSLETGVPLTVKLGADPSAPDIHIGHAVVLRKLRQFQDLGHRVVFVIGDYTGLIGDPSGRSRTRPQLTEAEIKENALTYQDQVQRILNPELCEITFNSRWLSPLRFADLIRLASTYTVARMLERDDFEKRFRAEQPISIHEFLYPLAQAYDSVELKADVELGGTDQKFNFLMARQVQREYGVEPQVSMTMPLLVGTDGSDKMSKSLGNYVGISDPPADMFGKLMSIPDHLIGTYLNLAAGVKSEEVAGVEKDLQDGKRHPRDEKARMAGLVVSLYHGDDAAREAASEFNRVFKQRLLPSDIPDLVVGSAALVQGRILILDLMRMANMCSSNSEGRRLIQGGAVSLDDVRVQDHSAEVEPRGGEILRVGKRRFARLRLAP